jgi:tRNA(Ile)-lysidine synthetase-like protein
MNEFIDEWLSNPTFWFNADSIIDEYLTEKYSELLGEPVKNKQHAIILYDQLPRHIFRNQAANHIILYYLDKALALITQINPDAIYDATTWCFVMLPLRHNTDSSSQELFNLLEKAWMRLEASSDDFNTCKILKRFIKATYARIHIKQLVLCEFHIPENKLVKNVEQRFKSRLAGGNNIILSLSGGVDSMVCLDIFTKLMHTYDFKLTLVHINYMNRPESIVEEEKIIKWTAGNHKLIVRRINEINRPKCMKYDLRALYETYTRNVRYGVYKALDGPVILGHNKDDCLENIFTNIANRTKYDNLQGMTHISTSDSIEFWRPLLDFSKDEIVEYSRVYNIPHLPNSTPPWSQRGQIRAKVLPCLNEWNPNFIKGLFEITRKT